LTHFQDINFRTLNSLIFVLAENWCNEM